MEQNQQARQRRKSRRGKARLKGFGFDYANGHIRMTRGENFKLMYGSNNTHKKMQEKAIQFMRLVKERGLSMNNISRSECREIFSAMGMSSEEIGVG